MSTFSLTFPATCGKLLFLCRTRSRRWAPGSAPGRCGLGTPRWGPPQRTRLEVSSGTLPPLSPSSCCGTVCLSSWCHCFLLDVLLLLLLFTVSPQPAALITTVPLSRWIMWTRLDFLSPVAKINPHQVDRWSHLLNKDTVLRLNVKICCFCLTVVIVNHQNALISVLICLFIF